MDGTETEGECPLANQYRVIGIFPSTSGYQVKLIKSEYLTYEETESSLKVNETPTTTSPSGWVPRVESRDDIDAFSWTGYYESEHNGWQWSNLNRGLNKTDGLYLKTLEPYVKARLISDTTWYIGGNDFSKITKQPNIKLAYDNELGENRLTLETGQGMCSDNIGNIEDCTEDYLYQTNKIGLMYATEYGYAASPAGWNTQLYSCGRIEIQMTNWLYNGVSEGTISREAGRVTDVLRVGQSGGVYLMDVSEDDVCGMRPVFFLENGTEYLNGNGSKTNPWRIKLS